MAYGELEKELGKCMDQYPPDFDRAKELLRKGADINAMTGLDNETLLSETIMNCEAFDSCTYCISRDCDSCEGKENDEEIGKHYLIEIIKFFLENGYNTSLENGAHGGEALYALCFSTYDKYILDAAKILLDAGADPLYITDTVPEDQNVLDAVDWKYSGCLPVYGDLEQQCLFLVLYDIMEAKTKGMPYSEIHWHDAAIGKRIDRIYSCAPSDSEAVFDFSTDEHHYTNCFKDNIVLECEGIKLVLTHYCHAFVNPYIVPEHPKDLSTHLGTLIGKRISKISFSLNGNQSVLQVTMDDGSMLVIRDNANCRDEEYCARFSLE